MTKRNRPGQGRPFTHGGSAAVRDISAGKPLQGLAALEERSVRAQLETEGRLELIITLASRLTAAANLYWNALQASAERGNLAELDRYIARFGWLAQASIRAWATVGTDESRKAEDIGALIKALREGRRDDGA